MWYMFVCAFIDMLFEWISEWGVAAFFPCNRSRFFCYLPNSAGHWTSHSQTFYDPLNRCHNRNSKNYLQFFSRRIEKQSLPCPLSVHLQDWNLWPHIFASWDPAAPRMRSSDWFTARRSSRAWNAPRKRQEPVESVAWCGCRPKDAWKLGRYISTGFRLKQWNFPARSTKFGINRWSTVLFFKHFFLASTWTLGPLCEEKSSKVDLLRAKGANQDTFCTATSLAAARCAAGGQFVFVQWLWKEASLYHMHFKLSTSSNWMTCDLGKQSASSWYQKTGSNRSDFNSRIVTAGGSDRGIWSAGYCVMSTTWTSCWAQQQHRFLFGEQCGSGSQVRLEEAT